MARASFYGSPGYHGDDCITRHLTGDAPGPLGTVQLLCGVSYCPPRPDLGDRGQMEAGILARRCRTALRRGLRRYGVAAGQTSGRKGNGSSKVDPRRCVSSHTAHLAASGWVDSLASGSPTGGRSLGINSLSPHLIAQREKKVFSVALLLLQTTPELLIYLQPLEHGAPARPTSSRQQQKRFSDTLPGDSSKWQLPGERFTNSTGCNEVRAFRLSGL